MNDNQSLPELEARVIVVLPVEDQIELEWAGVNDCGALGPSREEPELFYQEVEA